MWPFSKKHQHTWTDFEKFEDWYYYVDKWRGQTVPNSNFVKRGIRRHCTGCGEYDVHYES